jgi:sulfur relay (sulfurtransferase) DsrF/TusC family protein
MTIAVIQTHVATDAHSWFGQDALLNLASLDLNPQLIVIAAAVKHLCHGADVQRQQRSLQKRYRLLQLYDCPKPWVVDTDMQQFDLTSDDFIIDIEVLSAAELQQRLCQCHQVLRF